MKICEWVGPLSHIIIEVKKILVFVATGLFVQKSCIILHILVQY